ncbi:MULTISPECIES: bifunctional acetate--CoA ligase family protein/GNAT family N-acetyltransferase [Azospira]|jgi:acetyltransferase|uniref:Acyl-CoA synthetase (NDP forming) n=2 Tax=Azospira oryzae TaxID=146939 RepID=G8QJT1_AZOOP|nr:MULTISPECIES: bifunctional acetate--CoA ligase family protein/GNAT family N-acetyltransferase [Azospira]MBP7489802.1 bifunctional acetate--CoA ligase family protein/GNAT family N-acetyltransferase [Azospira sp.]TLS20119.1 MAG: bifunctional acetate--CoA ligase family protein/GNAT family N-acetyltransferase [Betaproteobacteria bacterium]AEV26555.1 acyl-CoA synthetase (NDP forming) [Azospira oryzae PS]RZT89593.1 acetyltransferase [Azospira oryzae]BBN88030.1 acetyl CoA synthetase subunit alpha 
MHEEEHYLTSLFEPKSVAVIGASDRENSVGNIIYRNIVAAGYKGRLYPINPKHDTVQGVQAYKSIEEIGARVDLAVIATQARTVPAIIEQCGRSGVKNVVVITAGFAEAGHSGAALERKMVEIARSYGVRILGPNCLGLIRPVQGLNATFANISANPGNLALVSQSGALCTAILDWAKVNDVGFSSVISTGGSADIDFGEILDYLVYDNRTHYILMYVEGIRNARRFMSAMRSAARIKPILLLKAGRYESGSVAAQVHSGMALGSDAVFDAALKRAGVVRVRNIGQLFYAAKGLASKFRPDGNKLLIITNGGGPGAMAADRAAELGIPLADLSQSTIASLNAVLPPTWSHANPIDIVGDATPERYRDAILAGTQDPEVDGILVMLTPQAMTQPEEVAKAVITASETCTKPIVGCWMGEQQTYPARKMLTEAGIPAFRMPETAVDLFSHLSTYYRNQKLLLQTPEPISRQAKTATEGAKMLIEAVLSERRKVLSEMESKSVLRAFKIPVAQTMVARTPTEALLLAEQIGFPVVMKVDSPDLPRKSEVGGVRLNIISAAAVRNAYHDILDTVGRNAPSARINGVSIEPFVARPNGRELKVGVIRDRVFGPVITFGVGGAECEVFNDTAVALPPMNSYLVEDLIRSTRAAKILGDYRNMPAANMEALEDVLLRISQMVCELPWLQELDLNPLIVDENGAIAADARIVIDFAPSSGDRYSHMAIHPYPAHLVEDWVLPDGQVVVIRPIRPEDAEMEKEFVAHLSDESKYFRFMDTLRELTQSMLVRFTQIDYDREMAFVAVTEEDGKEVQVGVSRFVSNPDGETVEFALAVADGWQKRGVGRKLMSAIIECARAKGYRAVVGDVLALNSKMFKLMTSLGFTIHPHPEDPAVKRVIKPLTD